MKISLSLLLTLTVLQALSSCTLVKAVDYSFHVAEHGDYEYDGHCYGIDDEPGERLLITDCGGYLNVIGATVTLGMLQSSAETVSLYRGATERYLEATYTNCRITNLKDLGGKVFEIAYRCD